MCRHKIDLIGNIEVKRDSGMRSKNSAGPEWDNGCDWSVSDEPVCNGRDENETVR